MIKIIIADNETIFRESLKFLVEQTNEIQVVACAINGQEALELCGKYLPDVVLMDLSMPICNGIEGTKLIKAQHKDIKILILTTMGDSKSVTEAVKYGADGYLLKDIRPDELILAIKSCTAGMKCMYGETLDTAVNNSSHSNDEPEWGPSSYKTFNLLENEINIIKHIVDGKTNKHIACELDITEGGVKNIITRILKKLNLHDRVQIVTFAIRNNILEL